MKGFVFRLLITALGLWAAATIVPGVTIHGVGNLVIAALLLGAQLMSIGFLAELITAYQGRDEDSYSIAEQTGFSRYKLQISNTKTHPLTPDGGLES